MEVTLETQPVETDIRFWLASANRRAKAVKDLPEPYYIIDTQIAQYLDKYFKGYMMDHPVAVINTNVQLEAKSEVFHTIDDLDTQLGNKSETHDLYLHDLMYIPGMPVYKTLDSISFEPVTLEKPEIRGGVWKIRYASVEKEKQNA